MTTTGMLTIATLSMGIGFGTVLAQLAINPPTPGLTCSAPARTMARLEMLFGTARSHGSPISDEEWRSFLDTEVTPRFPAGLTVLRGPGQWRGENGRLTREESKILVIWYEPSNSAESGIEAIRAAYKARFDQESVMRVDSVSCVSF